MTINEETSKDKIDEQVMQSETKSNQIELDAIKHINKRTNEQLMRNALKLRKVGLISITLCVFTFMVTLFTGVGLYYWYKAKLVTIESMFIVRFTSENLMMFQIIHGVAASLTLLFFFIFIVSFLNFQKKYSSIPHAGKTRKVSGFITSTAGLVLIVMIVLNFLTGTVIPNKEDALKETQKELVSETQQKQNNPMSIEEFQKKVMKMRAIGEKELKSEKDINLLLHTTLLPVIFGILIFIILFDVYALQKAKFRDNTPKIKPH